MVYTAGSNWHVKFAFPKSRRLRKRVDIVGVQRAGNAIHTRYFVVVCDVQGRGRLGITVSKKVGNAVNRNRVKRLVREFVRTARPIARSAPSGLPTGLPTGSSSDSGSGTASSSLDSEWLASNLDVVVIAKKHASSATAAELWRDLANAQASMLSLGQAGAAS